MTKAEGVVLGAPSEAPVESVSRSRWNMWAWAGLVASVLIPLARWSMWGTTSAVNADYLFSTQSLLHASAPIQTLWWIQAWAVLVAPLAYVAALASRSVGAVRLSAAAVAQVALFVIYRNVQRYVVPPWLEWWFFGAIMIVVIAAVVVLRVERVGSPDGSRRAAPAPRVGARSSAIISVGCGALLLSLPAVLFAEVARSHSDEDDTVSRRLAAIGTALGALGLAIALGYLLQTTQKTD